MLEETRSLANTTSQSLLQKRTHATNATASGAAMSPHLNALRGLNLVPPHGKPLSNRVRRGRPVSPWVGWSFVSDDRHRVDLPVFV